MSKKRDTHSEMDAAQARLALAALFGDAAPAPADSSHAGASARPATTLPQVPDEVSLRVERLRRKREAREEILRAAAASGLTLEELQQALAADKP
jgi:hypothetical protein